MLENVYKLKIDILLVLKGKNFFTRKLWYVSPRSVSEIVLSMVGPDSRVLLTHCNPQSRDWSFFTETSISLSEPKPRLKGRTLW